MESQAIQPDIKQIISGKAVGSCSENADSDDVDSIRSRSKTDVPPLYRPLYRLNEVAKLPV